MILLLDVGNSQIFGGVTSVERTRDPKLEFHFRMSSRSTMSSDEMGLFFRDLLRESGLDPRKITKIGISSVVPSLMHSLKGACSKYFGIQPFCLEVGVKHPITIRADNPSELGADRLANAIGAVTRYPDRNLMIVDLGTATTFCAITKAKEFVGGAILPGVRIQMESLESRTAKLPTVEIARPPFACAKDTITNIQSGLYFGHLGAIKEFITRFKVEVFNGEAPLVIGTGGFAGLFKGDGVFDVELPDLVLYGLYDGLWLNS